MSTNFNLKVTFILISPGANNCAVILDGLLYLYNLNYFRYTKNTTSSQKDMKITKENKVQNQLNRSFIRTVANWTSKLKLLGLGFLDRIVASIFPGQKSIICEFAWVSLTNHTKWESPEIMHINAIWVCSKNKITVCINVRNNSSARNSFREQENLTVDSTALKHANKQNHNFTLFSRQSLKAMSINRK